MSSGQESCRKWGCSAAAPVRVRCRCTVMGVGVGVAARVGKCCPRLTGSASEGLIGQLSREPLPLAAQCLACQISGSRGHGGGGEEWSELATGTYGLRAVRLSGTGTPGCQAHQPTKAPTHRGLPCPEPSFAALLSPSTTRQVAPSCTSLQINAESRQNGTRIFDHLVRGALLPTPFPDALDG